MGFLRVLNYVPHCYTNADGDAIKELVEDHLKKGQQVTVSFEGVDSVSSSFLNSAFIPLLDTIKKNIIFKDSSKPINDAIKRRFSFEVFERQ